MVVRWHRIRNASAPWGDYGRMLVSGMTERRGLDGRLPLLRTGPFVPPITVSGISDLIVTQAFRAELEASGLIGFGFAEVVKKRIVKLDWRSWDLSADEPARYPAGGEPEQYVLGRTHDQSTADSLGPMFEVAVERDVDSPGDADLVRTALVPFSRLLASEQAVAWLSDAAAEWLDFEPHP